MHWEGGAFLKQQYIKDKLSNPRLITCVLISAEIKTNNKHQYNNILHASFFISLMRNLGYAGDDSANALDDPGAGVGHRTPS